MGNNVKIAVHKDYIIERYQAGATFAELAREFGCSEGGIKHVVKKNGIPLRENKRAPKDWTIYEDKVRELYAQDISAYEMIKILGIAHGSLFRLLKKLGLSVSHRSKIREDFLKNHTDEIIQLYKSGKSESQIGKLFDCEGTSISKILRKNNIKTRFIYKVNHNFFSKIDDENKAYVLGLFMADGCNYQENNIGIGLADLEILEKIKEIIEYDGPILFRKRQIEHHQDQYLLCVGSSQMTQDLIKLNCPPNKTFVTKLPDSSLLPDHLFRHFVRGLLDGDGSIYKTKKDNRYQISIAGTRELIDAIFIKINKTLDVNRGGVYNHGKIVFLRYYSRKDVIKIANWLWKDSTIHLDRKYKKYLQMLEDYKKYIAPNSV